MLTAFLRAFLTPDLRKKLLFTLGIIALFRFGSALPAPGINEANVSYCSNVASTSGLAGTLQIVDLLSGNALKYMSVFALGIMPYITASIILQLLTVVIPRLETLKNEGQAGQQKITQYTRYGAVLLAIIQGTGIATQLQNYQNPAVVLHPGFTFVVMTVITLCAGTIFLMWIGEQMSEFGIGNGTSVLIYAGIAVFIAGLMVGRTPEYLGKKIEAREIKMAMLAILCLPLTILGFTALASVSPDGLAGLGNSGPHGFSEIFYAYTSATANNGSAFGGLTAATPFYDATLGFAMLIGRFLFIVPMLAAAGSLAAKKHTPPSAGSFPTDGALFIALLVGVILIVGGLTYFPAIALGPVVEHVAMQAGNLF